MVSYGVRLAVCLGSMLLVHVSILSSRGKLWSAMALEIDEVWNFKEIHEKYDVREVLGFGSGGAHVVFQALMRNDTTGTKQLALKLEKANDGMSQIKREAAFYGFLDAFQSTRGAFFKPSEIVLGSEYHYMVLPMCEYTLEDLVVNHQYNLPIRMSLNITLALLSKIQQLHSSGVIHGDIKPSNVCFRSPMSEITLIDFGLSKLFINPLTGDHISCQDGQRLTTNALFASRHAHGGLEQSRRDDMESLMYMLIFLLKGRLPWGHLFKYEELKSTPYDKFANRIGELKWKTSPAELCSGLPIQISNFARAILNLECCSKPEYEKLQNELLMVLNIASV